MLYRWFFINSSSTICNRSYTNEMRQCILDGGVTDPDIRFKVWYGICGTHITRQDQVGFLCPVGESAFSRLVYYGVLPYLAFGPFAVQLQDSIFRRCNGFRPQLQMVTPGIPDDHSEGEVSLLLGLRSWWSELTYTMSFGLNSFNGCCLFMPRVQCDVFGFGPSMWPRQGTSYHLILTKYAWAGPGI